MLSKLLARPIGSQALGASGRRAASACCVLSALALLAPSATWAQSCVYSWSGVGGGVESFGPASVSTLAVFDDGEGEALFVGGLFTTVGGIPAQNLARWDGLAWSTIGANNLVSTLTVLDDGGGPALYAGGRFSQIAGQNIATIARLKEGTWSPVGPALFGTPLFNAAPSVLAVSLFNDGTGEKLYVGGDFNVNPSSPSYGLARLEGGAWTPVGGMLSGTPPNTFIPVLGAMAAFEAGGEKTLVVAGNFEGVGGIKAKNIASWNGSTWSPLGDGLFLHSTLVIPSVLQLLPRSEAGKSVLYAGGRFTTVMFGTHGCVARWDGSTWETLGSGISLTAQPPRYVAAMEETDLGGKQRLAIGGAFDSVGGTPLQNLALWDGQVFSAFGNPTSSFGSSYGVLDLLAATSKAGPSLYAGGSMTTIAGGTNAKSLAQFKCLTGDLNGDGKVGQEDLGLLLASFGIGAGGDLDGDNDTDQADLGILLATYGS